ncbi:MAG: DUF1835 domain-containing protein [Ferruginibacter sp.]|nr:DUF1835 domain-containing protein [Ferruginibacter sp.]
MIHIVFNEADVDVLQSAITLDESMQGDVLCIQDDYSVGPVQNLYSAEGMELRRAWWKQVQEGYEAEKKVTTDTPDDYDTIAGVVGKLRRDEQETVWIWAAQNKKDVSGYYWLLHYLKPFAGRIYILYLNNLPFLNEKGGIFYPLNLHEIPPREFLKAKKLARPITLSEFEVDPDEWEKLASAGMPVRILEGGKKLVQHPEQFFDTELKKFVTPDWQKATKVIQQFKGKAKQTTGEAYLLWRLKFMAAEGKLEVQSKSVHLKDVEVKLMQA